MEGDNFTIVHDISKWIVDGKWWTGWVLESPPYLTNYSPSLFVAVFGCAPINHIPNLRGWGISGYSVKLSYDQELHSLPIPLWSRL